MRAKMLISLCVIFVLAILYMAKKLHLHNFWKGEKALTELMKEIDPLKLSSEKSSNFIYIAHAGGGYNGRSYLNSLEAINNSYGLGLSFIEIDFHYTLDSVMVLSHDFVNLNAKDFLADKTLGTHLTMKDLMV